MSWLVTWRSASSRSEKERQQSNGADIIVRIGIVGPVQLVRRHAVGSRKSWVLE